MSLSTQWRSVNFSSLLIEEWEGEFTVFQPDSGKTHFLNQMGMLVLLVLDKTPVTSKMLCDILIEQQQLPADKEFSYHIEKILQRFDTLGLVEKVG